ncbi:MAG TPA: sugar phosphate nucleotidyltransferase [candidate division Zixibacteria bacterium]|nr:sugar phosphate nucleotidyltransferase [candidate division Zixibacteria bacterium]
MKGVILAGGAGTRLKPLTDTLNKHLLPLAGRPMIHYPAATLATLGVTEALVVSDERWLESLRAALDSDRFAGVRFSFAAQNTPDGIVGALRCAQQFADNSPLAVILGDNALERAPENTVRAFAENPRGAQVFHTTVKNPGEFGVATLNGEHITALEEKPAAPASHHAIIGLYLYDTTVFDRVSRLRPSARGEYEITDLNRSYLADNALRGAPLDGWWVDCGSHESLRRAEELIAARPPQWLKKQQAETRI